MKGWVIGALAFVLLPAVVAGAEQGVQVLRIASGPDGANVNGTYRLNEERARFDPSKDTQVIVLFQWAGPVGPHRIGVLWRSPDASLSSSTAIDYVAKASPFGAYFSLPLKPSLPAGVWSIEATMDGQPAGRYTFELTPMAMRAAAATRRALSPQQMFARLQKIFVLLDREAGDGRHLDADAAFVFAPGRLATAVAAMDGSDALVATMPDASRQKIDAVAGINRAQDWAVLRAAAPADAAALSIASAVVVGDRCFSMQGAASGNRLLSTGTVTGHVDGDGSGARWIAQWDGGDPAPGAPVLDAFGDLIGLVGGGLTPGLSTLTELLEARARLKGVPIVPASFIRLVPDAPLEPLADLRAKGEWLPALRGSENVLSGGFAKTLIKGRSMPQASELREEFAASEGTFVAFVTWAPQSRVKGALSFRLMDAANRVLTTSKPKKINLRPGASGISSWASSIPPVAGWYHGVVLLDGVPVYRAFVHVTQ
ncbi:MAG TPA: trypsin-like peptidase domain-containing protein [Vicinamibacterales bacterium]|nr:trypsin-like peptidase domain-containing protein [Vicinamibacterales bacterium]